MTDKYEHFPEEVANMFRGMNEAEKQAKEQAKINKANRVNVKIDKELVAVFELFGENRDDKINRALREWLMNKLM